MIKRFQTATIDYDDKRMQELLPYSEPFFTYIVIKECQTTIIDYYYKRIQYIHYQTPNHIIPTKPSLGQLEIQEIFSLSI